MRVRRERRQRVAELGQHALAEEDGVVDALERRAQHQCAVGVLRRRADVDDVECAVNAAALVAWVERTSPHSEAKCSWLLVHSPTAMRGNGATSCAVRAVHTVALSRGSMDDAHKAMLSVRSLSKALATALHDNAIPQRLT